MYNELYEIWKREASDKGLTMLPADFYPRVAEYVKKLKEEGRMLDKRTAKAALLKKEMAGVKKMVREITQLRYKKILKTVACGESPPEGVLTAEEDKIFKNASLDAETYQNIVKGIFHGVPPKTEAARRHDRMVLRFMDDVPAIIGADMATYGPFKAEDVASLPVENSRILCKQGLAREVEVN
ncbi:DNA replication complex GINS family protein [Candidatus Bathyarchaeota archaeon]|nr:DNA replication complex GINS family protein [Candidatus Bathyarchaeota archaeon]